jgi:hypothetical protein
VIPFNFPPEPHRRRHGPVGYANPESFRPWLRDEFTFRCVYCLRRERWEPGQTFFAIDHWLAIVNSPHLHLDYPNLRYSCSVCNSVKGDRRLPDPCLALLSGCVTIESDGQIIGRTPDARRIILVLGLNDAEFVQYRARWIRIVAMARQHAPELYQQLLGFPDDLPDLASLRPPGGNILPHGIEQSYLRQRQRGELPETY